MMRALPEEFTIRESSNDGLGLFANRELIIFPTAISHIYHPFIGGCVQQLVPLSTTVSHQTVPLKKALLKYIQEVPLMILI